MTLEYPELHAPVEAMRSQRERAEAWRAEIHALVLNPDSHMVRVLRQVTGRSSDGSSVRALVLDAILEVTTELSNLYREELKIDQETWEDAMTRE